MSVHFPLINHSTVSVSRRQCRRRRIDTPLAPRQSRIRHYHRGGGVPTSRSQLVIFFLFFFIFPIEQTVRHSVCAQIITFVVVESERKRSNNEKNKNK